jgi:hypothetical protein
MIVTCCACEPELTYGWMIFLQDVNELLLYTAPAAGCILLWKHFVTGKRGLRADMVTLGLDDSAKVYSELPEPAISNWIVVLYLITGLATFTLGVLAFSVVHAFS